MRLCDHWCHLEGANRPCDGARRAQSFAKGQEGTVMLACCAYRRARGQPGGGPSFKTQSDSRQLIGKSAAKTRYVSLPPTTLSICKLSSIPTTLDASVYCLYFLALCRPLIVSPSATAMPQS